MKGLWPIAVLAALLTACSKEQPEPTAEDRNKEGGLIEMSAEAQGHVALEVEEASVQQLNEYLQVPGTVQPTDSRTNVIRPLARGRLEAVLVRVGDRVKAGQALARYDNMEAGELLSQLRVARAELQRLGVQERNLGRQANRALALADIGAVPKKEHEQARADQQSAAAAIASQESVVAGLVARLQRFGVAETALPAAPVSTLRSPLDGVVTKLSASPGEVIEPATELFTIIDLSVVWVQAEVYEKDLGRLRLGQAASIVVDTYPGEQFSGKVSYISDFLDPRTRTAKVRCEVANGGMRLKLDMFASVNLPTTLSRRVLAVHAGAIQQIGDRTVVFVRKSPTKFEPRWVTAGSTVGDLVEITNGLNAGEPVVKNGAFHLKSILVGKDLAEE